MYKICFDGGIGFLFILSLFQSSTKFIFPQDKSQCLEESVLLKGVREKIVPSIDLVRYVFEIYNLPYYKIFVYFNIRVPLRLPKYRDFNNGWKSQFFFVRPSECQLSFNTYWRLSQIYL